MHVRLVIGIWSFATVFSAACGGEVRDVRGYEITESGLIGRSMASSNDIHWIDNERVLLIGARADDYVVPAPGRKERRFRLFMWYPKQQRVVEHHDADIALGRLCVFNTYARLHYTSDYRMSPEWRRWYVFEGALGRESIKQPDAAAVEERRNHIRVLNPHTCREYDTRKLPKLGTRVRPLLEGEFTSREREPRAGEVVHWKYWPRRGNPIDLNMTPEVIGVTRYSRYRDSYVLAEGPRSVQFSDTVVRRSWLMNRSGKVRDFTPPSGPWMRGSTYVAPTREGLLLISHAVVVGGNGAAGAYLQKGNQLVRIIPGLPVSFGTAPNGCDVALSIYDKTKSETAIPHVKAINVCRGSTS